MSSPVGSIEKSETIVILDFGSQYAQLIARRVRDSGVYSVLARPDVSAAELADINVKGLIFTGGPSSVYEDGAPKCQPEMLELGVLAPEVQDDDSFRFFY